MTTSFYRIDWKVVARVVNKKLGKNYAQSYVRSVYNGDHHSPKLRAIIDKILSKHNPPDRLLPGAVTRETAHAQGGAQASGS